jgi:septal ring factor EnvC (AmiA/AmiB activator)
MLDYSNKGVGSVLAAEAGASASELQAVKDNMSKTATVLDQLSKAILALRDQVAKLEADFAEVRPQIIAFKVHTESFPQALREARRSDNAVLKAVEGFEGRLRELEARLNGHAGTKGPAE